MQYGTVTGGSVSLYDLYELAGDIANGGINLPFATNTGLLLATQNGEGLSIVRRTENASKTYVDTAIASMKDEIMTAIMTGTITLPLHTKAGEEIACQDNVTIAAYKAVQ